MSVICRQSALRFLKIRPRSVEELRVKLTHKGFEAGEIKQVIEWLLNTRLLDDRAFTRSWIQYRLARPFGFRRIAEELKMKGVDHALIEEEMAQFKEDTNEEQMALDLVSRRAKTLEGIEPLKKKKRLFDFLIRRGFAPDIVIKVLKQ